MTRSKVITDVITSGKIPNEELIINTLLFEGQSVIKGMYYNNLKPTLSLNLLKTFIKNKDILSALPKHKLLVLLHNFSDQFKQLNNDERRIMYNTLLESGIITKMKAYNKDRDDVLAYLQQIGLNLGLERTFMLQSIAESPEVFYELFGVFKGFDPEFDAVLDEANKNAIKMRNEKAQKEAAAAQAAREREAAVAQAARERKEAQKAAEAQEHKKQQAAARPIIDKILNSLKQGKYGLPETIRINNKTVNFEVAIEKYATRDEWKTIVSSIIRAQYKVQTADDLSRFETSLRVIERGRKIFGIPTCSVTMFVEAFLYRTALTIYGINELEMDYKNYSKHSSSIARAREVEEIVSRHRVIFGHPHITDEYYRHSTSQLGANRKKIHDSLKNKRSYTSNRLKRYVLTVGMAAVPEKLTEFTEKTERMISDMMYRKKKGRV